MTDHQKLLTAMLAEDARLGGDVSVFNVMTMLYMLGEGQPHAVHRQLVPVSA